MDRFFPRKPWHPPVPAAALAVLLALPFHAQASVPADIADMSIEELANIQITSVSKKPERLASAAASVFVITADDIRRSGAASLPEALRLAPNLQVAQRSGYEYAISARGMNGSANSVPNKLLVLIDGRTAYSPLFSGVSWDTQEVMLEDVERIEVISGPGGTLWGVNAVNGVINITTRAASETGGSLLALRGGSREYSAGFRQGNAAQGWRVFGSVLGQRHTELETGARVDDARHQAQVGFRRDWDRGADRYSVHGDAYRGRSGQPKPGAVSNGQDLALGRISTSGANLTGRWTHALDGGGSVMLQGYFERSKHDVPPTFAETLDIADLQFQHSLPKSGMHEPVWGVNYRYTWDDVTNSEIFAFLPAKVNQTWASVFAQDELALREDLRLTAGARVEHNPYTGSELLPNLRLAWQLAPQHALWAGLSRTVRAPSRLDVDAYLRSKPVDLLQGGPNVRSEVAKVFELGYRGQPAPGLSYSVTAFVNHYDHLRTQEIDPTVTHYIFDSKMKGRARGIEMWGNYQAAAYWRLSAGLTALHERFEAKPGSNDTVSPLTSGRDPSHTAQLRSSFTISDNKEFDLVLRKVGRLAQEPVPGYTALDARFGWRLSDKLELSLSGTNLNGSHAEYGPLATRTDVPRQLAVKLVWRDI